MGLYLVRHAKAGSRSKWEGPDEERPLTPPGWAQAEGLVALLDGLATGRLLSSPYVRCVQTLEPLAAQVGRAVEAVDALAEGTPLPTVLTLIEQVPDGSALCSHGDVIPEVVDALVRRGMAVLSQPDWRKGATWVIERGANGEFETGTAWPPPGSPPV